MSFASGPPEVEARDDVEQLIIAHLRQWNLAAAFEHVAGKTGLGGQKLFDLLFHRSAADELVDEHRHRLADAERAIGRLVLDRRIPIIEVNDMRRSREIQAGAAGLERQDEKGLRSSC